MHQMKTRLHGRSKINSEAFNVTGKQAFTLNEIRIMAGFEPIAGLDDIEPDEDTEGNPDENPQD